MTNPVDSTTVTPFASHAFLISAFKVVKKSSPFNYESKLAVAEVVFSAVKVIVIFMSYAASILS